jgi:CRP/FNR family transcriptional regulator, cyclic AMP receptor protein
MIVTTYDLLAAHPFLSGLTHHQLTLLSAWGNRSVFHGGARVFPEGGRATRFWLIRSGQVRLGTHLPGRGEVVVETLGPGTVLGWSWLFEPYRWHFGAVAVEETLTVEMDGAGVRRLCEQDPALGYELTRRFMAVVVDRLQATRMRLLDLYGTPP